MDGNLGFAAKCSLFIYDSKGLPAPPFATAACPCSASWSGSFISFCSQEVTMSEEYGNTIIGIISTTNAMRGEGCRCHAAQKGISSASKKARFLAQDQELNVSNCFRRRLG